jgi:hypothetical protein
MIFSTIASPRPVPLSSARRSARRFSAGAPPDADAIVANADLYDALASVVCQLRFYEDIAPVPDRLDRVLDHVGQRLAHQDFIEIDFGDIIIEI